VSEESGHVSLVERGRVFRALDQERLRTALRAMLRPSDARGRAASSVARLGPSRLMSASRRRGTRSLPETGQPPMPADEAGSPPVEPGAAAPQNGASVSPAASNGATSAQTSQAKMAASAVPGSASRAE